MNAIRVGFIGADRIATDLHIPNFFTYGSKVKIVAIADVAEKSARKLQNNLK